MTRRDFSKDPSYLNWFRSANLNLTRRELSEIETRVKKEVEILSGLSTKDRFLYMKRDEIQRWYPTQSAKDLLWVQRNIFSTRGRSDFRRIEPELVEISEDFLLSTKNIWGESSPIVIKNKDSHKTHWNILRTLVSSAPNDGMVGRAIRFLVIDRTTNTYLGVICIGSAMFRNIPIHEEIGWDAEVIKKRGAKSGRPGLHSIANGQTIVPTQPFGSNFLGGKLLALLCLSDVVVNAWQRKYGDKLVGVHTTSLYGSNDGTQYSNLSPYWRELSPTPGQEAIKLTPTTYELLKLWLKNKFPMKYYQLYEAKNEETGMLETRESKSQALPFVYRQIGVENYTSGEQRGVYSSFLYSNSVDYLNERITEKELVPAFDNSVGALTDFWRFGSMGDTTKPTEELKRKEKKPDRIRKKIEMKGLVKGNLSKRGSKRLVTSGPKVEWYLPIKDLSWDEVRSRYSDQPEANETPQAVL